MRIKHLIGLAVLVTLGVVSYLIFAAVGERNVLLLSLGGLLYVAFIRYAVTRSASFRASYFPAIYKGMGIKATSDIRSGVRGFWTLSITGFIPLAMLGWWVILASHVVMVWFIIDDIKTAAKLQAE